jgi:phage baseplate assembly protein W
MATAAAKARFNLLGSGIIRPFQRISGSDFVHAVGEATVRSSIIQILGTKPGEITWRPEFGTDLERFRHRNATGALAQEIAEECAESISRWEPRVKVSGIVARVQDNIIYVKVVWAVVSTASAGNNVLIGPVTQEVTV